MVKIRVRWRSTSSRGEVRKCVSVSTNSITDICICICTVWNSVLTQPFLPQASRQFDQEGRKKFFTLDMNNILLEWVGQLLNHRQPNPSSLSSSLSAFLTHFQQISLATSPAVFKCFVFSPSLVRVNDMLLISIPLPCFFNFMLTLLPYTLSLCPPSFSPVPLPITVLF